MLTYPSDPLPQIVCPMDEDAIPPNRFCSAPPHSEPPPPLPPFSSITPSSADDGLSGHRRSGRIQGIRERTPKKQSDTSSETARKPHRQNLSPTKRHRERMVQVSQSKQPRVERRHGNEKQNQGGFDFSFVAEHQNEQKDQKSPGAKNDASTAENVVEQFADNTTHDLDASKSGMDACGGLTVGHTVETEAASKGWVIGPLFQSFRSKMASFTEIVMSPVKLFKANSPPPSTDYPNRDDECELQADGMSDVEPLEPSSMFHLEAQSKKGDQDAVANQQKLSDVEGAQTVDIKYSKNLSFDVELSASSSGQADECAITDSVPLQQSPLPCIVSEDVPEPVGPIFRSPLLFQPFVNLSASHVSELNVSGVNKKGILSVRLKPLPRRDVGNRKKVTSKICELRKEESDPEVIDGQVNSIQSNSSYADRTSSSSVCFAQPCTDWSDGDSDGKIENCHLIRQSLRNNLKDNVNGRTLKHSLDTQQLYTLQPNRETHSAAGLGRVKRDLKLDCRSQDLKRKRITADVCRKGSKKQQILNVASDSGALGGLKPPGRDFVSTNIIVDEEQTSRPAKTRQAVSLRNKKGKGGQEMLTMINEAVLNTQSESSPDPMVVCSSGTSEDKAKPSGACKRLKKRKGLCKPDANIENGMDLETTIAITSTKPVRPEPLSEVLVRPDIKQFQNTRTCPNVSKKPLKRKSPGHGGDPTESDSTLVSTSSAPSVEPLEVTPTDLNTSEQIQEEAGRRTGLNQSSKRPKKGFRGAAKSCASGGNQETKQSNFHLIAKENQSQEGQGRISVDPVYFEMTPFESNRQPSPSTSQPYLDSNVQLDNDNKEEEEKSAASEGFPIESGNHSGVSRLRSSARRVNIKPRRADNQRRKCRILHSRTRKGEEMTNSVTMDDADLAAAGTRNGLSRRLLRSYSCPEIPSFHSFDAPWTPLHGLHHSRIPTPHQQQASQAPLPHHVHRSLRRARRHTVCSVEVEREVAPLCLRKEVYPSRRSLPYDGVSQNLSPSVVLSTSTYLSALASSFLSSPLAFLSKKVDSRGAAASPSTSSHVSSPTSSSSSSSSYSLSTSTWLLSRTESSNATLDPATSGIPLQCEIERRHQSEEEDDGENTSSSSQEFEDVALREEKALSDSEIKVVQKHEERGKVSSIRIRKTLPKPQNNLTPMGLPKPIRLKKKEFSLEEIYTNKNFSKPPESRLETIFEVPLNRRNGSESWFGQRRLKRFLEFLEVGEARKPKKPLVGVGKAGITSSRTRRGGFPKDEPSLSVQDVDSLLCAKLDQLNLWLMHDQKDS